MIKYISVIVNKKYSNLITSTGTIQTVDASDLINTFLMNIVIPTIHKQGFYECKDIDLNNKYYVTEQLKKAGITIPKSIEPEKINHIVEESIRSNNIDGLKKFTDRLSKVEKEREFSVKSCADFISNNDMPITPEGNILGYKWLDKDDSKENTFVDCHTNKVCQSVGSVVEMDIKAVDPDRSADCSYGLHVASREYISHYKGQVMSLVLVKPEDIISVPTSDTSKIRVCRYQIIEAYDRTSETADKIISGDLDDDFITQLANKADTFPVKNTVVLKGRTQNFTVHKGDFSNYKTVKEVTAIQASLAKKVKKNLNDVASLKKNLLKEDCLSYIEKYIKGTKLTNLEKDTLELYRKAKKKSYEKLFENFPTMLARELEIHRNRKEITKKRKAKK